MNIENAPKEIMKSSRELETIANGLNDESHQPSAQQELERLFPGTRGRGRVGESRELHRVGAGELSAFTTTDTNTSFATSSTAKRMIAKIWGAKSSEDSQ